MRAADKSTQAKLKRRSWFATAAWLFIISLCLLFIGFKISAGNAFNSNILGLLPNSNAQSNDQNGEPHWRPALLENQELQQSLVVLLSHADTERSFTLANKLQDQLAQIPSLHIHRDSDALLKEITAFYRPFNQQLLSDEQRQLIQSNSSEELADQLIQLLYSPVRALRPYEMAEDPFNLGGAWLNALFPVSNQMIPGDIPSIKDNRSTPAVTWYIIRGEIEGSPFQSSNHLDINNTIAEFSTAHPDTKLLRSGMVFHASEAAKIARQEISTVGIGSILAIIALVVVVFRSARALLAISFTLASSMIVAMTACLLVFGHIHLITLAFGSTLLGLAVDYCFHFLLKYRRYGDALLTGKRIARGLALSASSTVVAYLIQLFSPFPGLQQFAVFIAAGLAAACLSIAVLSLVYSEGENVKPTWVGDKLWPRFSSIYKAIARQKTLLLSVLVLLCISLGALLANTKASDDIRLLNTSSNALLSNEQSIQDLLGGIDSQRYWVVEADNSEQLLEQTANTVAALKQASPKLHLMSVSQLVPPLSQQQADYALLTEKIYGPSGALTIFCTRLATDCKNFLGSRKVFDSSLALDHLPEEMAKGFPALLASDAQHSVIFPYLGKNASVAVQEAAQSDLPKNIRFVDQVQDITYTLSGFRLEVSRLLLLFFVVFAVVSAVIYRRKAALILSCILISQLTAITLSSTGGITLFHCLALLLVLGISVDTVIFYLELGLDADTWLASTLSMLTSILAFGLLSLSQVPLLHHFGSVVFFGLLSVWLITPVLTQLSISEHTKDLTTSRQ